VQTRTGTWRWCMGMFGARFAVFVRRARVLPGPCPAARNLSFSRFHRRRHPVVSTRWFSGMVRVGMKIPQDGNRANRYGHVAMVHGHVWRTVCSVCALDETLLICSTCTRTGGGGHLIGLSRLV
jgi:hypothetical protein